MKNKALIFFVLLLKISAFTYAQTEWAPIGAKWYYGYFKDMAYPFPVEYFTYETVKDTFVNGKNCHKLDIWYFNLQNDTVYWGFDLMYSDSGRVYYFYKNKFLLLYDFNVKVGDTLNLLLFNPNIPRIKDLPDTHYVKYCIRNTGTLTINNEHLRYYDISIVKLQDPLIMTNQQLCFTNRIIERIGDTNYLYGKIVSPNDEYPLRSNLRCYSDNKIQYFSSNAVSCDTFISAINEKSAVEDNIILYPNPVADHITIENKKSRNYNLQLYKINGQAIFSENNIRTNIFTIDTQHWDNGIYYILITSKSESIVKKIIKN